MAPQRKDERDGLASLILAALAVALIAACVLLCSCTPAHARPDTGSAPPPPPLCGEPPPPRTELGPLVATLGLVTVALLVTYAARLRQKGDP